MRARLGDAWIAIVGEIVDSVFDQLAITEVTVSLAVDEDKKARWGSEYTKSVSADLDRLLGNRLRYVSAFRDAGGKNEETGAYTMSRSALAIRNIPGKEPSR